MVLSWGYLAYCTRQWWTCKYENSNSISATLQNCVSATLFQAKKWGHGLNESTIVSAPFVLSLTLISLLLFIYLFIYSFLCRVTVQMLCNGNQFSFVLDRDVVVIFIHKNLMHVFSYPASFFAIGSGESRETAWALSTGGRYVVEGKYRNTREAVRVSTCIIIKAHPVFICTAVACHLQLLLHC